MIYLQLFLFYFVQNGNEFAEDARHTLETSPTRYMEKAFNKVYIPLYTLTDILQKFM